MIIIAFFFILWPGEYTDSNKESAPFSFCDVQLFVGQQQLDLLQDTIALILQAWFASLTFADQKNGVRCEVIGLGCTIIRFVLYLSLNSASPVVPLAQLINSNSHITASGITSTLQDAVTLLGPALSFLPLDISACCLHASGAMALLLG
ncbi:hypothetical protein ACHAW6_000908 [Cyclotella cf. meneghiniana]